MDLLYQRYASPFSFMDGMIKTGRFSEFIDRFIETVSEEKKEKPQWEYFLHKVYDKSYKAFSEELATDEQNREMSEQTIETTMQNSMNILGNFNPDRKGGDD